MTTFACRTRTGSLYVLTRDEAGDVWLTAQNVPHERSQPVLGDLAYPVDLRSAWPPRKGERLFIYARSVVGEPLLPQTYLTSPIVEVREVAP